MFSLEFLSACEHTVLLVLFLQLSLAQKIPATTGSSPLQKPLYIASGDRFKTIYTYIFYLVCVCVYIYTGAGHIIRISSKSWFISLIPFKKWNLYNVYIHSTQTDIFQVFISFNFDDYKWQLMKTPNSVSQKIRILWKGSILKTPGATL